MKKKELEKSYQKELGEAERKRKRQLEEEERLRREEEVKHEKKRKKIKKGIILIQIMLISVMKIFFQEKFGILHLKESVKAYLFLH